jgi:uncharacterized membrane protein YuzA (DUF378 family)
MKLKGFAELLLVIGGLNWGLSLLNVNLVTLLFGSVPALVSVVYGLVGLAALYVGYEMMQKK